MDLDTGNVTPIGKPFGGMWTQGAFQATISSYDRCNLFVSSMYDVITNPLQSIPAFIGVDMSSGELQFSYDWGQDASTAINYINPDIAAAM